MKTLSIIALISAIALTATACSGNSHDARDSQHDMHEGEAPGNEGHEEGVIVIHGHQAEELGIRVEEVKSDVFATPVKVSGEVIYNPSNQSVIAAPMSGRISYASNMATGAQVARGARIGTISTAGMAGGDMLQGARIEYEAAKKEVERLKPLREEGIVTVGEYNAAVTALERAKNNLSGGAGSVVTAPMSGVISSLTAGEGSYVNAGDVVGVITGDGAMTLRVDIPSKDMPQIAPATKVNVKFPQLDNIVEATAVSGRNTVASTPGYVSMYYNLPATANIVAGSFGEVYLPSAAGRNVMTVPLTSVTDRMGQKMVYVKEGGSDHYRRVAVETGATDGKYVEITGLHEGDLVVTEGVTFVRLAENAGVTPPGHSHNH